MRPYDHTPANDTNGLRRLIFALTQPPGLDEILMERVETDIQDITSQIDTLIQRIRSQKENPCNLNS